MALATVAFAQTARLREAGADIWPAYFAGHSLGEYNALSAFADVIPLETVLELVFHRGSTMHHLIERDAQGRSNYRMVPAPEPVRCGRRARQGIRGIRGQGVRRIPGDRELQPRRPAVRHRRYDRRTQALKADSARRVAAFGGKPAFMLVPGIDVPFHSTLLRKGVPEFREKLDALDASMNNFSLILRLTFGKTRILLPGDTNRADYGGIPPEKLAADLFKVGHHGQLDGADAALVNAVRPRFSVCCASSDRRYNSAHPDTMRLLKDSGAELYFSDCPPVDGQSIPPHRHSNSPSVRTARQASVIFPERPPMYKRRSKTWLK